MRLNEYEVNAIKDTIHSFDSNANIYLFGSRVYDHKKGGDIDLLIISDILIQKNARDIKDVLYDKLGEQKIDIVIVKDTSHPFTRIALKESINLWKEMKWNCSWVCTYSNWTNI